MFFVSRETAGGMRVKSLFSWMFIVNMVSVGLNGNGREEANVMSENQKDELERKVGYEGFVLLLSLIFISIFITTSYEIPSNLLLIILFFIGSGYYSIRLVSKGLLRKKRGLGFKAGLFAFVVWMALSFLFHDISYPFTLEGLSFQILLFFLFYIPFFFIFQFAFKISNIQERKQ